MNVQDMLNLKIHDVIKIENGVLATRVPGGWIYYLQTDINTTPAETFVPEPYSLNYDKQYLQSTEHSKMVTVLSFLVGTFITFVVIGIISSW